MKMQKSNPLIQGAPDASKMANILEILIFWDAHLEENIIKFIPAPNPRPNF
jgi:hypothetical protein